MYKICIQNEITLAHEQTLHLKGSPIEPSNKPSVSLPHFILTLEPGPIPAAAFYEAGMALHVPHPPGLPRRTQSPAAGLENLGSSRWSEKPGGETARPPDELLVHALLLALPGLEVHSASIWVTHVTHKAHVQQVWVTHQHTLTHMHLVTHHVHQVWVSHQAYPCKNNKKNRD